MAVVLTSGVEDGMVSNCEENEAPAEFIIYNMNIVQEKQS